MRAASFPKTLQKLENGGETRIVCFGDSITAVLPHRQPDGLSELVAQGLRRLFPNARVQMANAGVSGNTSRGALPRMERDVLQLKPDLW